MFCPTLTGSSVPHQSGYPLILDEPAGLEASDLVGSGAERYVERRLLEIARGVIGTREDRQAGDEQRRVARPLLDKAHDEGQVVRRLYSRHLAQALLDDRVALVLEELESERGVLRGELGAVVKARLRPQRKAIDEAVRRDAH